MDDENVSRLLLVLVGVSTESGVPKGYRAKVQPQFSGIAA